MKVVVGYIRSPEGRAALDAAVEEARLRGAELVVLHSMKKGGGRDEERDVVAYSEDLARVREQLEASGVPHEIRRLTGGDGPAPDILGVARDADASLIVIGLRRRSPVGKLVLGSNAQDILLQANCPVLAVKAD